MVSKCANPNRSAEFMYFGDGKLFGFESTSSRTARDFHWLCNECAKSLKLQRGEHDGIELVGANPPMEFNSRPERDLLKRRQIPF
jgi:hypothetical protein